jgi:hypothetical protein
MNLTAIHPAAGSRSAVSGIVLLNARVSPDINKKTRP